ncbi:sm-like protein LSM8 isoform X3 [Elaeis guineensis]|uniref:Sm-like protein LSM8 isoform X3 n=1 Tax=Elaeis guineensis var. tenera TaxID=51953 RepID=A0A6I9S6G9_ELAGV|nr:sm-like protein LSM8 isoform X3 [Elaeis guineensis]XP_010938366.1 sm-like protein LSM8 isoform X3 [Elaeis guineensis]
MSYGPGLQSLIDQTISVITNDGRHIVVIGPAELVLNGILKGFDQATNIILDESHERVYSTKNPIALTISRQLSLCILCRKVFSNLFWDCIL